MKYILSTFILVGIVLSSYGQQDESTTPQADSIPKEIRANALIYNLSKKYNDPAVTRMALYNLYALNPSIAILDSLALMYYENQQYASAALTAQDAASYNPNDLLANEIAAVSFDNLGIGAKAVPFYEKLYLENEDLGTLYRIAFIQYNLERFEESTNNANIMIDHTDAEKVSLYFPVNDNKNQVISLKAAALRLKGMIALAKENKAEALDYYNQALEIAPDFVVLKKQLEELDKKEE